MLDPEPLFVSADKNIFFYMAYKLLYSKGSRKKVLYFVARPLKGGWGNGRATKKKLLTKKCGH